MYLSNLKLWNFRKFGSKDEMVLSNKPNLDLDFTQGLNVIIGENDSGKTAIIDAIKLVLKTQSYEYIKVEDDDFHIGTNRFRIELSFDGLKPEEAKNFTEWLGYLKEDGKVIPYLRIMYDVKRDNQRILPADVKAGIDDDCYQLNAEAREYLKSNYLKPLRDAENELIAKRNSRLSQILLGDSAFKGKEETHDLVKMFTLFSENLNNYFNGTFKADLTSGGGSSQQKQAPQHGKRIKDSIDQHIRKFHGEQYESLFSATGNDIKAILEKLTLSLANETNPGLGTLNRLFMAAELLHLNKDDWTGIRLGLIEELEAHLHPQAQMQVIEALQDQTKVQLILTTHSPNLASKLKLQNLIICQNLNAFPMGNGKTLLEQDDYKFLEKFLDVTKSNLFFAKGVIIVEGWAEELLIPSIARYMGINLTQKGITIVNVGSLAHFNYVKIFLRNSSPDMTIPVAVITDADVRAFERTKDVRGTYQYSKVDEKEFTKETSAKIVTLSKNSSKNVQYFIANQWTLEYSLFKSKSLSKLFVEATREIYKSKTWGDNFELNLGKTLINKGLKKTEIAYNLAFKLDKLTPQSLSFEDTDDSINYIVKAIKYVSGI